jgi:N-methylhydantoinase A
LNSPDPIQALPTGWQIGVDVGGTFTDLVAIDNQGQSHAFKTPSTPSDPSIGVLAVLRIAAGSLSTSLQQFLAECSTFIHGTTVATNTLLESKGARVGLLTSAGFRDSLEIRRGIRENFWDHRAPNPPVLVPRYLRIGVGGRIDRHGREIEPLAVEDVIAAAEVFNRNGVEAIAVCLFNSYLSPAHEKLTAELISRHWKGEWISVSSDVIPVMGEYERTSTTVINCYVGPTMVCYLRRLDAVLHENRLNRPLLLMQSNGGAISLEQACAKPYTLLLSGPAAAVGAVHHFSRAIGSRDLISMEIGGTSCDVLLADQGRVAITEQVTVAGHHLSTPSVDIHTIGAGGGTIAGIDRGGLLFAGPRGAGAVPGPAAYGRGGADPTVTDAHLVLGRLRPGPYGGGAIVLDLNLARKAIETKVARPLGISMEAAAAGIIRLVEQSLLHAVQRISIERGYDPRRFVLLAGGGAGPMHGARIGRMLGCQRVYVPRLSGALCALGMLHSDVRHDLVRSYLAELNGVDVRLMSIVFSELEAHGRHLLTAEGFHNEKMGFHRELALRYLGQQWDLPVEITDIRLAHDTHEIRTRFEQEHARLFGHIQPEGTIEITKLRVTASGLLPKTVERAQQAAIAAPTPVEVRPVYIDDTHGWLDVPIFRGSELKPTHRLHGPLIIDEQTTTVLAWPGDVIEVDRAGNYAIHMGHGTGHA